MWYKFECVAAAEPNGHQPNNRPVERNPSTAEDSEKRISRAVKCFKAKKQKAVETAAAVALQGIDTLTPPKKKWKKNFLGGLNFWGIH